MHQRFPHLVLLVLLYQIRELLVGQRLRMEEQETEWKSGGMEDPSLPFFHSSFRPFAADLSSHVDGFGIALT